MKIAIPSDDKVSICVHFGRTKGFLIFDIENNTIKLLLTNPRNHRTELIHLRNVTFFKKDETFEYIYKGL